MRRVERLIYGTHQTLAIPGMAERAKGSKLVDEIFGALGYRDGSRFFMTDAEWEKRLQDQPPQPSEEMQIKLQELEIRREDNYLRDQREREKMSVDAELRMRDIAARENVTVAQLEAKLAIEGARDQTQREISAIGSAVKNREMNLKISSGSGI